MEFLKPSLPRADPNNGFHERNAMDAAGAANLRWRIEQQEQWRLAAAVLDGRQPAVDPDIEDLERFEHGLRIYHSRTIRDRTMQLCKRLIGGVWEIGTLEVLSPNEDPTGTAESGVASAA
jgi:hypothetical protein